MTVLQIVRSLALLQCTECGAEANATCNCGKPYVPAAMRVAEYDKANPGRSTRQAAADLRMSQSAVQKARGEHQCSPDNATVTGRDGKTYKAKRAPYQISDEEFEREEPTDFRRALRVHVGTAVELAELTKGILKDEPKALTNSIRSEIKQAARLWNELAAPKAPEECAS